MGRAFSDITLYTPTSHKPDTPEYWEETSLINFISDLYVQKMYNYKPPKTTRITIQPAFYDVWNRTWKNGSIIAIAPFFSHDEYTLLDRKGKYKYILDIIQTSTLQLSEEYQWDKNVFEKAYREILEIDFEFRIVYPPKMSRDKKKLGQVIVEKTETRTVLNLSLEIGEDIRIVKLFENRNWFWYDIAYEMAKNSRWLDNNCFGVFSKKSDKFGYYSLANKMITGKLDFKGNEIIF